MELVTQIKKFIEHPFPLWETTLTHQLVQHQWRELESRSFQSFSDYSTARVWLNNPSLKLDKRENVPENSLCIEMPSLHLQPFYDEHGLELLTENEIEGDATLSKLKKAFSVIKLIEPAYSCITDLVRSIHVLRQPDLEIDLSYSHPEIPFSIFLSVCDDDLTISNMRVAESILHEAMHLKLTLIENIVPLVQPNTLCSYYSPWRDEERPLKGVLHGLFVFRAILEFNKRLTDAFSDHKTVEYIIERRKEIEEEIASLQGFRNSAGFTEEGANLAAGLLPLN